jgi:hypothetical protein
MFITIIYKLNVHFMHLLILYFVIIQTIKNKLFSNNIMILFEKSLHHSNANKLFFPIFDVTASEH